MKYFSTEKRILIAKQSLEQVVRFLILMGLASWEVEGLVHVAVDDALRERRKKPDPPEVGA